MKSVLISVRPQWCELIASGKKTIEVRKTRPKLKTPFRCYIYCTVGGDALCPPHKNSPKWDIHRKNNGATNGREMIAMERAESDYRFANGKVIGEFVCDDVITDLRGENTDILCKDGCLTLDELKEYGGNKPLYGWHISALQIYDKPRELGGFNLKRAPQSWCYCEESEDE